ncbi:MAG: hypothetical protein WC744_02245 [Patescibacteria group bacterium]|jgi:hypothetical protein
MKKIIDHKKFPEWLTVITISLVVSTLNVFHVVFGQAKTPVGFTYLATGHYYLDYFEYLQHIAAGIAERWLPTNYFTTGPSPVDWRFFPYILLGKVAWIFHLSPMTAYWIAVFVLTALTLTGFYYLINLMIPKESFALKITAFLLSIFSGPAYQIFIKNGQLVLNPYDFWYGPATFIRRFEVVPYHALGLLLLILAILLINKTWKRLSDISEKTVMIKGFFVGILLTTMMTFSPLVLASFLPALSIMSAIHFIKFKKDRLKIFLFNVILLVMIIPVGLVLRGSPGYGGFGFEIKWMNHDPWWYVLLNLGPIILFFPFGLIDYLKENNFLRQLLLIFSLVSYGLFVSPLAYYLGTHNLRFFSSISFVCYGVLAVLGIKIISSLFKNISKIVLIFISLVLIFYSCFLTFYTINKRLIGLDAGSPETIWTYMPNPIIDGLRSLQNFPQTNNVLTGPYGGIGMFVPTFSYKKVYVGHQTGTPDIEKKRMISYLFYSGTMSDKEAVNFFKTNKIEFVVLTSFDNFDPNIINRYTFLKQIFVKDLIIIWGVNK